MSSGDAIIVDSWLVIGWDVRRGVPDRRCFDAEDQAHFFIWSFSDPDKWIAISEPERISRSVVVP